MAKLFNNWLERRIFLYNVTFGLYMLEWWERCLFNTIMILLLCVICYNSSRFTLKTIKRFIFYTSGMGAAYHPHCNNLGNLIPEDL